MKKTRFFKPYLKKGKCTLKRTGSGVYIIKKDDDIVYVGMSYGDVKKTMYRHFQQWNDKRSQFAKDTDGHARVSYYGQNIDRFRCRVIFTNTGSQADKLEQFLIKKYKPEQNGLKLYMLTKNDEEKLKKDLSKKTEDIMQWNDEYFYKPKKEENEYVPF